MQYPADGMLFTGEVTLYEDMFFVPFLSVWLLL